MNTNEPENKLVLIAEDETDLREALITAIETIGNYQVIAVDNGLDALEKALSEKPDHILLDIHMPKMNGDEVLEKLRHDEWGMKVPVTILTAQSDMVAIANAIAVGGSHTSYLIKSDISLAKVVDHITAQMR